MWGIAPAIADLRLRRIFAPPAGFAVWKPAGVGFDVWKPAGFGGGLVVAPPPVGGITIGIFFFLLS